MKNIIKFFLTIYFNIIESITKSKKNSINIQSGGDINIKYETLDDEPLFNEDIYEESSLDDSFRPYHALCLECTTNSTKCSNCCAFDSNWQKPLLASESLGHMSTSYHNYCIESGKYFVDENNNLYLGTCNPKHATQLNMHDSVIGSL